MKLSATSVPLFSKTNPYTAFSNQSQYSSFAYFEIPSFPKKSSYSLSQSWDVLSVPKPSVANKKASDISTFLHRLHRQDRTLTHAEVEYFLDEIIKGSFYNKASIEELHQVISLITKSIEKATEDPLELKEIRRDFQELLEDIKEFDFVGASYSSDFKAHLFLDAKNNTKSKDGFWRKIGNFCKKHRKAIIIGVCVVAAVVVVAITTIAIINTVGAAALAESAAAAGAAAGAIGNAKPLENEESDDIEQNDPKITLTTPSEKECHPNQQIDIETIKSDEISLDKDLLIQNIEILKENNPINPSYNSNENSFIQMAKNVGAKIAHDLYDKWAEFEGIGVLEAENIRDYIAKLLPKNLLDSLDANTFEKQQEAATAIHNKIDQLFSTRQATNYLPEVKSRNPVAIGIMPSPWHILGALRIPTTCVNNVKGWSIGQPINNLTGKGDIPRWSSVRQRHWKNKAYLHENGQIQGPLVYEASTENVARMKQGLAPQIKNARGQLESIELHHSPPQREGGLFNFIEVTQKEHISLDPYRK